MNFTPEVIAALAVLRNAAENDFERHRLDVLERDLTAPPIVEVIDENRQTFNGVIFKKQGDERYRYNLGIHQFVWLYCKGNIPQGCDIHHCDINPDNNQISNLQLLTSSEHRKIHSSRANQKKRTCVCCGKIYTSFGRGRVRFCSKECSYKWRHEHPTDKRTCMACGKDFFVEPSSKQRYCSVLCATGARRVREERNCVICGKKFFAKPSQKTQCCSMSCGSKLASLHAGKNIEDVKKTCVICGKEFTVDKSHTSVRTCSRSCGTKLANQVRNAKRIKK